MRRRAALFWLLLVALAVFAVAAQVYQDSVPDDPAVGRLSAISHDTDLSHLQVGDCVYDTILTPTGLTEIACSQPHQGEVVGRFPATGDYPGQGRVTDGVGRTCRQLFEAYAPAHAGKGFDIFYSVPSPRQWSTKDYYFTCIATDHTFRVGGLTGPNPSAAGPVSPGISPTAR